MDAQASPALELARFAASLRIGDIPDRVRAAAQLHIVDTIGVCIAACGPDEEAGAAARALSRRWTGEGATLFGVGSKIRADLAALVNGALAQALEMDDKHGSSLARPGSTVIPAVLAVAEAENASLDEAIAATVVGYEVMIRLGFVGGERFLERGYHTSSLLGAFGVAAAVGRLRNLAAENIVEALGIAGSMAGGIQEATRTGSTSKILHGGWGAHSGIIAVDLAEAGITGPASVFEGEFGFFKTHLTPIKGELNWPAATAELGTRWDLPDTGYKPYPCCQLLHAFIDAAKHLIVEMRRDGLGAKDITDVMCKLAEPGLTLVTQPEDRKRAPSLPHEARFSLPFVVATALIHGEVGFDTFRAERLEDRTIRALAAKVRWAEDPDSDYPNHCPAILEVAAGGKHYRKHVPFHPGCPEAPLSFDDVLDKFARNASWFYGDRARGLAAQLAKAPGGGRLKDALAPLAQHAK